MMKFAIPGTELSVHVVPKLEKGKIITMSDRIFIPDDGTIYKIIFMNGITDQALDHAFEYAKKKCLHL